MSSVELNDTQTTRSLRKRKTAPKILSDEILEPKTPSRKTTAVMELTRTPQSVLQQAEEQTPRRSTRKSVKPAQDYTDIVNKSAAKREAETASDAESANALESQPRWTPAKVGRVSQKRSGRRGRSTRKSKLNKTISNEECSEGETLIESGNNLQSESESKIGITENYVEKGTETFTPDENDENCSEDQNKVPTEDNCVEVLLDINISSPVTCEELNKHEEQNLTLPTVDESKDPLNEEASEDFTKAGHHDNIPTPIITKEYEDPKGEKTLEKNSTTVATEEREDPQGEKALEKNSTATGARKDSLEVVPSEESTKPGRHENTITNVVDEYKDIQEERILEENCAPFANMEESIEEVILEEDIQSINANKESKVPDESNASQEKNIESVLNTTFEKIEDESCKELPPIEVKINKNISIHTGKIDLTEMGVTPIEYDKDEDENINSEMVSSNDKDSAEITAKQVPKNKETNKVDDVPKVSMKNNLDEDEEMPSLIFCDDDDDDNDQSKEAANDTFNASDCMIISPNEMNATNPHPTLKDVKGTPTAKINRQQKLPQPTKTSNSSLLFETQKRVKELQSNYFARQSRPNNRKAPKILLSNESHTEVLLSTPQPFNKRRASITPLKRLVKSPKNPPNAYGFVTPQKQKNFNFSKADKENGRGKLATPKILLTTMEPTQIVLRSIRKRSKSLTIENNEGKRNVTFYSPANQTACVTELDKIIANKMEKLTKDKRLVAKQLSNVTRRKRSISLDERHLRNPSKLPRRIRTPNRACPIALQTTSSGQTPQKPTTSRTKLPNFAAIHQKQYDKMENLVDYVARKNERAQQLTNSALKARNVTVLKPSEFQKSKLNATQLFNTLPHSEVKKTAEKMSFRQRRHVEMFKSRTVETNNPSRKNAELIRGVRSNRRFELMMAHRKTGGN